jgi:hypothetical protein
MTGLEIEQTKERKMADLKYVTYCGLYCRHCVNFARIPQQAKALYDTMQREGYEFFGPYQAPEFNDFWKHLKKLTELDKTNPSCRGGCGDPGCKIRICAGEKGHEICVYCDEYPCDKFEFLIRQYPALLGDGKKLKEMGMDAWLAEQEARCERGYCFSEGRYDIRNQQE